MDKKNIVIIWSEGFPFSFSASNEKNKLLAKAFQSDETEVLILSKGLPPKGKSVFGISEGIPFRFLGKPRQNKYISFVFSITEELLFLYKISKTYSKVFLIASYVPLQIYTLYAIYAKIIGFKLLLNIMEWHIAQTEKSSLLKRINPYLFDLLAFKMSAAAITISSFIQNKLMIQKKQAKVILIPALADVEKIRTISPTKIDCENYLLYCGGIGYYEVVKLILDAYFLYYNKNQKVDDQLKLILHGDQQKIELLKREIQDMGLSNHVEIIQGLSYSNLVSYYKGANALLIPLRDIDQDRARYPQKMAEYAACEKPIISNRIGQIAQDFTHLENIYFIDNYSPEALANGFFNLLNNPGLKKQIGSQAKVLADQIFDYKQYQLPLRNLINEL